MQGMELIGSAVTKFINKLYSDIKRLSFSLEGVGVPDISGVINFWKEE